MSASTNSTSDAEKDASTNGALQQSILSLQAP